MSKKKDEAVEHLIEVAEEAIDTGVDWRGMPPIQRQAHEKLEEAVEEVKDAD